MKGRESLSGIFGKEKEIGRRDSEKYIYIYIFFFFLNNVDVEKCESFKFYVASSKRVKKESNIC